MKLEIDIQCCNDCPFCEKYEFSDCSYSVRCGHKKAPKKAPKIGYGNCGCKEEGGDKYLKEIPEWCPIKSIKLKDVLNFASKMPKPYKISSLPFPKEYAMEMLFVLQQQIPKGLYCYDEKGKCPFWELKKGKSKQENGYCHYLDWGDWMSADGGLLWDQCKACGINEDLEEVEEL